MILCQALLLQGDAGLLCSRDALFNGVTSVGEASRLCKLLYGHSVVPVFKSKSSSGKRIVFANVAEGVAPTEKKESEDEFWARILADAAQQIARQNNERVENARRVHRRIPEPEVPRPWETGTIPNPNLDREREVRVEEARAVLEDVIVETPRPVPPRRMERRAYRYEGNGQWNITRTPAEN